MADLENPFTRVKKTEEVKDAGKSLNFNEVQGPQTPEQESKNKISVVGSTLGTGLDYERTLDDKGRFSVGGGFRSGGAFDGPLAVVKTNYDVLQVGSSIKGNLGVGALAGAGPDTAVAAVMANAGLTYKNFNANLGIGPGVAASLDDRYGASQTIPTIIVEASVGYKF